MNNDLTAKYNTLLEFISRQQKPLIIAIEGKCASGKTTLANMFKDKFAIIHIDDFFLPESKKTKERLSEVGGNINYEAIYDLLVDIKENKRICYQKFDCHTQTYSEVMLPYNEVVILEGVYSYHPYFNKLIDKLVYLEIYPSIQRKRIMARPNAQKFFEEWIPLENKYYESTDIFKHVDLRYKMISPLD